MHKARIEPMPPHTVYAAIRAVPLMDMSKAATLARLSFQSMRGADSGGSFLPQHEVIIDDHLVTCIAVAAMESMEQSALESSNG